LSIEGRLSKHSPCGPRIIVPPWTPSITVHPLAPMALAMRSSALSRGLLARLSRLASSAGVSGVLRRATAVGKFRFKARGGAEAGGAGAAAVLFSVLAGSAEGESDGCTAGNVIARGEGGRASSGSERAVGGVRGVDLSAGLSAGGGRAWSSIQRSSLRGGSERFKTCCWTRSEPKTKCNNSTARAAGRREEAVNRKTKTLGGKQPVGGAV